MILEVDGLVAGYGQSVVVTGVSFHVSEGEITSLVGRNGAGKTTTIRALVGLVRPRAGHVLLRGRAIAGLAPYAIARSGVGYVPDDRRIFPDLTVEEQLRLAARVAARAGPWSLERVYGLFPTLRELRASRGSHLSGGEQKMLAIGRALIGNPHLILLDDPSEGLAPMVVQRLAEILREIRATGVSVLLADQNLRFCRRVADRAYVMEKGSIVAHGPMQAIWENQELIARHLAV
ncbi:MAG: ABC transporter ATP-binding protein [Armatimonadota bacterium]|nr:ABC transporter ATP-binding protein [Armatimonadota bacterium]